MALKQSDLILKTWLELVSDAAAPYDPAACFVGVSPAIVDHGALTVIGDVTLATGAVATRVAIGSWTAPYKMTDGRWVIDGEVCVFSPASAAEGQAVSWWYISTLAVAGVLKAFAPLPQTYNLIDENSQLTIVPRITIDPSGRFSAEIVWNG